MRVVFALALLAAASETLQGGDNVWTSLGPDRGSVTTLAFDPQSPNTLYAATDAGVIKSTDGGASWSEPKPVLSAWVSVSSLTIDRQDPTVLYAATGRGVFKSMDGGESWSDVSSGLPTLIYVSSLAIDPHNPSTLYAATDAGLFKTTDGGASWSGVNSGLPDIGIRALAIDPQNPSTLYVTPGIREYYYELRDRGRGLFKSTDGGASWNAANSGLPTDSGNAYVCALAVDPQNPGTLYAGTPAAGVYKTTDGGASWIATGLLTQDGCATVLAVDPQHPGTVFAGVTSYERAGQWDVSGELFKSTDGGGRWSSVVIFPPGDVLRASIISILAIDPQNPGTVYVRTVGYASDGLFKTTDGAASWITVPASIRAASVNGVRGATVNTLAVDPQAPGALYVGIWGDRLFKSADWGASWSAVNSGLPDGGVTFVAIDPQDATVLYATTGRGVFRSKNGGSSWSAVNSGLPDGGVTFVAIDPQNPSTVYALAGRVFKSTDSGSSWSATTPVTLLTPAGVRSEIPVFSLAIDPQNTSTLYAGGYSGVFKSADGGKSWSAASSGFPLGYVGSLVIDSHNASTLYAANFDSGEGVFKSTDGGASWHSANSGLPTSEYYSPAVLAIDPKNPSTLYAGTMSGVFKSTDGGANWSAVNSGLSTQFVRTLAVDPQNPSTVYAGTESGGVFAITFVP